MKCDKVCKRECVEDKCCVPLKKCTKKKSDCNCFVKEECTECDTPYTVKVDVCGDYCKKECDYKKCNDLCDCKRCKEEYCPKFCDTLSVEYKPG